MIVELVTSIVSIVAEYTVAPIGHQIGYVLKYKSNVENFKEGVKELKGKKERVQDRVDEAKRNVEEIYPDVDDWLNSVNKITQEAGEFEDEDKANKQCLSGWCPNLKSRYQLSKKAKNKTKDVNKLLGKGNFSTVSRRIHLQGIRITAICEVYVDLKSRKADLKKIMEALESSDLCMIGVYGMPGVGKTVLAEQVYKKAEEGKLFDQVVMATIKEPLNVNNIQETIAAKLGLKFDKERESERADLIWQRLTMNENKSLVILDNVCKELKLKEIGIPFRDKGCKILLTSRYRAVLSCDMGTEREFLVEVLPEDEAWRLFEKLGDVKDAERSVAIDVAKRCVGLPVLIVTVARALKDKSSYEWEDALKKLADFNSSDDEDDWIAQVYSRLELSYNHLKGEEVKSLFLLCGQLLHFKIFIQDLLRYSLGLGILKGIKSLEEARNRVHRLVNDLKASCLLLDGESPSSVKMHDLVRKFAIFIASRDQHVFVVDYNSEYEWPEKDMLEQCTSISFPSNSTIHELPEELQCPQVKFFHLTSGNPSLKIPENFFKGMEKLKVLDLTEVHLLSLPLSLQFLENLRTLCLDYCVLEDIAALGELQKLEILSLIGSSIVQLPREIGKLTHLQLLDLSRCSKLDVISPDVLSSLSQLQELYMGKSFVQWEIEESNSQRSNAGLAELKNLSKLISLDIHIPDAKILSNDFFSERLKRYNILIGDEWDWSGMNRTSKLLKLKLHICFHLEYYGVKMLLKETEDLFLDELKGVENVLFELDGEGFPLLKHLHVQNSPEILYIINSTQRVSFTAFPILESLILEKLIDLEKICNGQLTAESFVKLRTIKVESCHKLRYLFSISLANGLRQLQEIEVTKCENMEEIVVDEGEDDVNYNAVIDKIEFTQLRSLTLQHLPQLIRFCSIAKMPAVSQRGQMLLTSDKRSKEIVSEDELTTPTPLFNEKVVFRNLKELKLFSINIEHIWHDQHLARSLHVQNLTHLIVDGCDSLKYLFSISMVESLVKLQRLEICHCKFMERVIVTEEGRMIEKLFPDLYYLKLEDLSKLTRFCSGNFIELPFLYLLVVQNCPNLKTFISHSICADIMASEEHEEMKPKENLCADEHAFFDDKVGLPDLTLLVITHMNELKKIWHGQLASDAFCKLEKLVIKYCKNLVNIFPSNMMERLQRLEDLNLIDCGSLEEVFEHQGPHVRKTQAEAAPQLRRLNLGNLPKLKHVWNEDIQEVLAFQNLRSIQVENCQSLEHLFPAFVARRLLQLEEFKISSCRMKEIVAKEKGEEAATGFVFPRVTSMTLSNLPKLKSFYPGILTSEWPMLKELVVDNCQKVEGFASKFSSFQETHGESQHDFPVQQFLFLVEKVAFPNLEELRLICNHTMKEIWHGQFSARFFSKLKVLELKHFCEKFAIFPSIPFQNLTTLIVSQCHGLIHLVTPSTAKSLVQLTKMSIIKCDMIEEIVNKGEEKQDEIAFSRLKYMELHCLPRLTSFCSGNYTFEFPSLEEVIVRQCPKMKIFSIGASRAPILQEIQVAEDERRWKGDLNKTIQWLSIEMIGFHFLEHLNLSEVPNIQEIWHGQNPVRFRHLKSLVVDKCSFLLNAIPSNLLQFLNNLEVLDVRNCDLLEEVFDLEGLNADEGHVELLSQLSKFSLSDLPQLRHIWNEDGQRIFGLKNLKLLEVNNCSSLRNICAPSLALAFAQLEKMEVNNCPMIEKIITTGVEEGEIDKIVFPRLGSIILKSLHNLTSFHSGASILECTSLKEMTIIDCPNMKTFTTTFLREIAGDGDEQRIGEGQLDIIIAPLFNQQAVFPNLTYLFVEGCGSLRYLFTSFMVKGLVQLKSLQIRECKIMEEIIVTEGSQEEGCLDKMLFPKLESLLLKDLPKLTRFRTANSITCLVLKELGIENCPELKSFISNSLSADRTASSEREEMNLEEKLNTDIIPLFDEKVVFPNLRGLFVKGCGSLRYLFTSFMVKGLVQLERFQILECKILEEIIVTEGSQEEGCLDKILFPKLESLLLKNLPKLTRFCTANFITCLVLKELGIENCPELKSFISNSLNADRTASSEREEMNLEEKLNTDIIPLFDEKAVFPNLRGLSVEGCGSLRCLFTSFMVKGLVQLERLQICECKIMEEIIVTEGSQEEGCLDKILFPKLEWLLLKALPKLTRFCTANSITCLVLKELVIENCPELKSFISNSLSADRTASSEVEEMNLEEKLDTDIIPLFDEKVVLPSLDGLRISHMNLQKIWHDKLDANSFCQLQRLIIEFCGKLLNIFPSNMLTRLQRLEVLSVRNCGLIEEVFELHKLDASKTHVVTAIPLRNLFLADLPNLKHVWNKDPIRILIFQNLQSVTAYQCQSLKTLFPASVARGLHQLEMLQILRCGVEEIVAKEKGVEAPTSFVFPRVTSLELCALPELKSFYPVMHISEWPLLKKLMVYECGKVEILASRSLNFQETHGKSQHKIPIQQPLFLVDKVAFPNLEELILVRNESMKEIWHGQFSAEYFCKLKVLHLICFPKEFAIFPSCFLQELPYLEKLIVRNAFFKEIFPCKRIYDEERQAGMALARLSELKLFELPELMHLWKEGFQGGPAFENLGTLEVSKCDNLKILVPSSISFQNLTILEVSKCHRLINLVTLSTARSLVQLSKMIITECELMTEVIANEGTEAKEEIAFNQLKYLGLHCLPSLTSFCSGSYTFQFPSLEDVIVKQCPELQIFAHGVLSTPKLQRVQLTEEGDKEQWEANLNSTIQHMFINKMNVMISEEE